MTDLKRTVDDLLRQGGAVNEEASNNFWIAQQLSLLQHLIARHHTNAGIAGGLIDEFGNGVHLEDWLRATGDALQAACSHWASLVRRARLETALIEKTRDERNPQR